MKPALAIALALAAVGCGQQPDPAVAAAAQAAEQARAADALAAQFDAQFQAGNWPLARAHGDVLLADHPDSAAARRVRPLLAQVRAKQAAADEEKRLAALWTYAVQPVGRDEQRSAVLYATDAIATGGGTSRVQLVFRDHPEWKRSSYLVLENGDFDCYGGCRVTVTVDGKARRMAASRPDTDEAIAMFIEDEMALWRAVRDSRRIVIEVPTRAGKAAASFDVAGLDPQRMPGW